MQNTLLRGLILAATAAATPVLAAPYTGIYMFGDSLYDNGQFDGVRFTNRVGPDYRSSDFGPVSPNFIADGLHLNEAAPSRDGGSNYAVGGNESLQTLQSITAATSYQAPYALSRPPIDPNFNSLFYDLERSGQSLARNAIYILDGGGNDIGNLKVFNDADAAVVAGNMVDAANALKTRGARYVVVTNVPDFGLAPAGINVSEFATSMAGKVNDQTQQLVGSDNILIFNAFGMIQEVVASPAAYGLALSSDEISRACFSTSIGSCAAGNAAAKLEGSNPDPDQFFFNDPLHPTTVGQQISADYMLSLLQAPGEVSLLPQMGNDDMQAQWRSARSVMHSNRWQASTAVGGYSVWGGAGGNENKHETDYNSKGTNKASLYTVGVSFRPAESWYIGAQLGRGDSELDFNSSASSYDMESLNFTVLGGFHHGPWFAEGAVSYSDLDYDQLNRSFSLGPVMQRAEKGNTSGETLGLMLSAGLNVVDAKKDYRFGPTWSYEYIDSEVDGFQEKSGTVTAIAVDDMDTSTSIGSAGVFGDLQLGLCNCELYSELTYRAYFANDTTNPRIGLVSVSGNSARLPGYEQNDSSIHWDVGMAARLSPAAELHISSGITDADNGDGFWYGAELIYSF